MSDGVRCMLMRGGTSKGAYFLAGDLPADPGERDDLLLRIISFARIRGRSTGSAGRIR
jgi:2-methylaconitate cis-trans-isomerase PrpF